MSDRLTHNIRSGALKGVATFSGPRSLQYFVEGLDALQAYEANPNATSLKKAAEKLGQCDPADALPQFYLGVVKTLEGYSGVDEAIRLFSAIRESGPEFLRVPAQYNLAVAHVVRYRSADFEIAEDLLRQMKRNIDNTREPTAEQHALKAQVLALLAFCVVRQRLWVNRFKTDVDHDALFEAGGTEALSLLNEAERELESPGLTEADRNEVLADKWNVRGLMFEYRALRETAAAREALAGEAIAAFESALKYRRNWIPGLSNMARVYQDVLGSGVKAEALWRRVLTVRPDDEYTNYRLGRLYEERNDLATACAHYVKAPNIPEASARIEVLSPQLEWWQRPSRPGSRSSS
jgi:tetratricopeptide (TPR) repeat protein